MKLAGVLVAMVLGGAFFRKEQLDLVEDHVVHLKITVGVGGLAHNLMACVHAGIYHKPLKVECFLQWGKQRETPSRSAFTPLQRTKTLNDAGFTTERQ